MTKRIVVPRDRWDATQFARLKPKDNAATGKNLKTTESNDMILVWYCIQIPKIGNEWNAYPVLFCLYKRDKSRILHKILRGLYVASLDLSYSDVYMRLTPYIKR